MAALWDLTNTNMCLVNDLLSLKKELAQGSLESLLPVLSAEGRSAQAVADEMMEAVRNTITEFDAVAKILMRACEERENLEGRDALVAFVEGCRYCCTANLQWR